MNDIGYLNLEYKGSEAEATVKGLSAESLKYRCRYTEMAVDYHKREQNPKQVIFFEAELKLIDKRLRRLNKKAALAR